MAEQAIPPFDLTGESHIDVFGAREHNLKDIDVSIPRKKLIVVTGISGSGKSSLAFDTIYNEGQRRYMESFSAYARQMIGNMERPDVDKISGLSPVISIEQKTTSRNPRSTVGTVTEVYDFIRLLYARAGTAYSYVTGNEMVRQTEDQIIESVFREYPEQKITLLAPVVKGRKGHYRELFVQLRKQGFTKARVDGEIVDLVPKMQVDRYKIHDIEVVVDRLVIKEKDRFRFTQSLATAMKQGKGSVILLVHQDKKDQERAYSKFLTDPIAGISYPDPAPNMFSFNSPYGACQTCNGLGVQENITPESIIPDKNKSIRKGALAPLGEYRDVWIFQVLSALAKKFNTTLSKPVKDYPEELVKAILYGTDVELRIKSKTHKGTYWNSSFDGIIPFLKHQKQEGGTQSFRQWMDEFVEEEVCETCNGQRLRKESLHFKIGETTIGQLSLMNLSELGEWFDSVDSKLTDRQAVIGKEVIKEIRKRLGFLLNVGLGYLSMNRPLKTLSGGEAQRIRLATQIGTQLTEVLYILDEPSIGLHQRDNVKLIKALQDLRDLGNTVLVVEHDRDMMLASDYILDIGPGAGRHGGRVIGEGKPDDFLTFDGSTAQFLNGKRTIEVPKVRRKGTGEKIVLKGASGHNLQNVKLEVPLGQMIVVTGVSGSGKSSLIHGTLYPLLSAHVYNSKKKPLPYKSIEGLDLIDKVIEVDQAPIGRTPRSNPATYTGVFTDIRALFEKMPESQIRGYKMGRFSFNVKGGRCEDCLGAGKQVIEMDFLPDVYVDCPTCRGRRYNRETLEVRFKGKSISDVLDMTVEEAVEFFSNQPRILRKIQTLNDVGLDYITLGQHATTLSGGEAQRVKLATELSKRDTGKTLYILDEPTTGLHFQDIEHLLGVLNRLVDKGNTVLVIEHNLDVIKVADHLIDVGPDGGAEGGQIIAKGTPEKVAKSTKGFTAKFLLEELNRG